MTASELAHGHERYPRPACCGSHTRRSAFRSERPQRSLPTRASATAFAPRWQPCVRAGRTTLREIKLSALVRRPTWMDAQDRARRRRGGEADSSARHDTNNTCARHGHATPSSPISRSRVAKYDTIRGVRPRTRHLHPHEALHEPPTDQANRRCLAGSSTSPRKEEFRFPLPSGHELGQDPPFQSNRNCPVRTVLPRRSAQVPPNPALQSDGRVGRCAPSRVRR